MDDSPDLSCPTPQASYESITLAHGGGGRLMHRLIAGVFQAAFASDDLVTHHDGAVLELGGRVAVSTDTFTVSPLFFPGGDIGRLAVCGTVNDVAMCGARPRHLTAAFVLEEGLAMADLRRIAESMAAAAREAGVTIVSGDTKVVERGKADSVFITTTGLGTPLSGAPIAPERIRPSDAVLVSDCIGDHGVAVLSRRENLTFSSAIESDVRPVARAVEALFAAGVDVHCLRDPTRGGLASALCEIAASAHQGVFLKEESLPIRPEVADACELLGLDPLYVASEGCFVAIVKEAHRDRALGALRAAGCQNAALIGRVTDEHPAAVVLESALGTRRVVDMLAGEQLPRIC